MAAMIEIDRLSHRFADGTWGLREVSLTVEEGEFVVVAGENGSGKTTLLRHLNALLRPTAGRVRVCGVDAAREPLKARLLVGMLFQDAESQIVGETVREDVAFGPENLGLPRPEIDRRVAEALARTGLVHLADRRPHLLSGGEKRRLTLAGVLAMEPRVVVGDEPFASLDYAGVRGVLEVLVSLQRQGRTVIVTTHDLDKVLAHADRLVLMKGGRILCEGRPGQALACVEACGVKRPATDARGIRGLTWLS
ncbi:MAG: ABC transporter ATP-binding protein [Desulfobacterales bacterium]